VNLALAVLDERRRTLGSAVAAFEADRETVSGENRLAADHLEVLSQEVRRAETEAAEATAQLEAAQESLQRRQTGRGSLETDLQGARDLVAGLTAQRAEAQAKLDALSARLEYQASRIQTAAQVMQATEGSLQTAEAAVRELAEGRKQSEDRAQARLARVNALRESVSKMEAESRAASTELSAAVANQSRLQAQLEVLDEAERLLTGYADGARFLLDPTRQARLGVRGALSRLLELPSELETAIAAALGDAVDSVLIADSEIDQALELLDSENAGRAVAAERSRGAAPWLSPSF
jgi:chromosome segregation protein